MNWKDISMEFDVEDRKIFKTKMGIEPFGRSAVSIIIPFHNQADKVGRLVSSILQLTQSNPYEICLVDDASSDKKFIEKMKKVPQVTVARSDKHQGFAASLALGMKTTNYPRQLRTGEMLPAPQWLIFMHSDCVIEDPNWMLSMGQLLLKAKENNVKLVSACSNNPGVDILKREKTQPCEDKISNEPLPLFCAMLHRELFANIGGFLKGYFPYGYEETELFYRMKKFGFKQAVCGKSWVYHEGGGTINEMCRENPDIKKMIESNRERCIEDIRKLK